jgi:hypothetical protein
VKENARKALLLSIGADTTSTKVDGKYVPGVNGGFRGPFWPDNRFEYIPVPETKMRKTDGKWQWTGRYVEGGNITYQSSFGERLSQPMSSTMPPEFRDKLKHVAIHYDPRFRKSTLTYGDGREETRGKQLLKLNKDDLLVFCPSLENSETEDRGRFIMGYFAVENVFDFGLDDDEFKKRSNRTLSDVVKTYKNTNAHFSDSFAKAWGWENKSEMVQAYLSRKERDLVLVTGTENRSGLFKRAIRITAPHEGKYFVMPTPLVKSLGLRYPAKPLHFDRGWKWVEGNSYFKALLDLLEQGEGFI